MSLLLRTYEGISPGSVMLLSSHFDAFQANADLREKELLTIGTEMSLSQYPLTVFGGDCQLIDEEELAVRKKNPVIFERIKDGWVDCGRIEVDKSTWLLPNSDGITGRPDRIFFQIPQGGHWIRKRFTVLKRDMKDDEEHISPHWPLLCTFNHMKR